VTLHMHWGFLTRRELRGINDSITALCGAIVELMEIANKPNECNCADCKQRIWRVTLMEDK
jgi:hypothetical protein